MGGRYRDCWVVIKMPLVGDGSCCVNGYSENLGAGGLLAGGWKWQNGWTMKGVTIGNNERAKTKGDMKGCPAIKKGAGAKWTLGRVWGLRGGDKL